MNDESWLDTPLRRAPIARMFAVGESLVLLQRDGQGRELHGDTAHLARVVLGLLATPSSGRELLQRLEASLGETIEDPSIIGELLTVLRDAGALEPASTPAPRIASAPGPRIVLGLSGAIAATHAPALIQRLQERGFRVRIAATEGALRFVQREVLELLTHEPVVAGIWPEDERLRVPHIELAQWADAVVVCPASATTIARLAGGSFDSIVAAIALSTHAPVLVVPSMNASMLASPPVQRNLEQLVENGLHVAGAATGIEVADRPGARAPNRGAAPPPSVVVQLLEGVLRRRPLSRRVHEAEDWDAMYRDHLAQALPWHADRPDDDLLEVISGLLPAPASALEIGTGLGTLALALATAGHRVIATDLSDVALTDAQARDPESTVVWIRDDITDSTLRGRFDLIVDRGCLHGLHHHAQEAYAVTVTRLLAPAGVLLLETLAPDEASARGVTPKSLDALFGPALVLEAQAMGMKPNHEGTDIARRFVLRRA